MKVKKLSTPANATSKTRKAKPRARLNQQAQSLIKNAFFVKGEAERKCGTAWHEILFN
jgi:hypothetical protein